MAGTRCLPGSGGMGRWRRALGGMALCALAGCAVGPDFVRPAPPAVERYTSGPAPSATVAAAGHLQRFSPGATVAADWWRLFGSPPLDAAVREALAGSPTLEAAQASLRQSENALRAGYGIFFPQLDGQFDATRQKFSPARFGGAGGSIFNLFTLSATVSYALDLFGGERRAVESLAAQVELQRAAVRGTYLTLSGNVVTAVIARAAYREELRATEALLALQREQVAIGESQAAAGLVPYASVLSLRSQLAAVETTLPPLRQKLDQTGHLLATLAGRTPAEGAPPPLELAALTLPGELPVSLPSALVRQRPDILAAEAQLHGANAEIGVATAALFPSFTLNGSYGVNNTSLSDLFAGSSSFWSLGGNVTAPLFHGGTLWFKRQAALEAHRQALAAYRQTVLDAFAQVADTLRALEHDAETLDAQGRALAAAEEALQLVQANYRAGTVNYLQILTADSQYQQAKIGYLQAQAARLQDTAALFVALGGGWWNAKTVDAHD